MTVSVVILLYRVDHYLGMNFASVALPLAGVIGSIVATIEYYVPWTTEVLTSNTGNFLTAASWSPVMSGTASQNVLVDMLIILGMVIGLAQIPLVLTVDDTLGSTTAYRTVLAKLIPNSLSKNILPYFNGVQNNMDNWWQVGMVKLYSCAIPSHVIVTVLALR